MPFFRGPLAKLVQSCREKSGLTQTELDDRIGMRHGYIAKLESGGIKRPGPQVLERLEKVLGISRHEMGQAMGNLPPDQDTVMYTLERLSNMTDEERAVAYSQLPKKWQTILDQIARTYLERASKKRRG
jgi:transcriptional regulator with XRE-family HTH domain